MEKDKSPYIFVDNEVSNCELFIGFHAGVRIENKIKKAKKSIKVISPFVGDEQIILLNDKYKEGVDVKVIASDEKRIFNSPEESKILRIVIKQERFLIETENKKRNIFRKFISVLISLTMILFIALCGTNTNLFTVKWIDTDTLFVYLVIAVMIFIIIIALLLNKYDRWVIYKYKYKTVFPIKFIKYPDWKNEKTKNNKYIHSKVFIIDDQAFVGSVNFTGAGIESNIETCITITDSKTVSGLSDYFDRLYSHNWNVRNLYYYGKLVYNEPVN